MAKKSKKGKKKRPGPAGGAGRRATLVALAGEGIGNVIGQLASDAVGKYTQATNGRKKKRRPAGARSR